MSDYDYMDEGAAREQTLADGTHVPGPTSLPGTVKRGRYGPGGGYFWLAVYADGPESPCVYRTKAEALRELETHHDRDYAVKQARDTLATFTGAGGGR